MIGESKVNLDDLDDAVRFVNASFERDVQSEQLDFKGIVEMAPRDFVDDASHLGNRHQPPGWLRAYPEGEWLDELRGACSRDFDHILDYYRDKRMPPGIQIDGEMGDGRGRAMFHYALGIPTMPVAIYVSRRQKRARR